MIIRPYVLIYEHIASHITDERDDAAEGPGWIQSQDWPPVLRPEFYLSRTDFVDDVIVDESGWEQTQNPDPVRRIPFYPSYSDLGGLDDPPLEGPGWDNYSFPPVLRPNYYLSPSDLGGLDAPAVEGAGWVQSQDWPPILRLAWYLSQTVQDQSEPEDPGWVQTRDPDPVLRVPFYPSPSDLGGLDAPPLEGAGWEQSKDWDPIRRLAWYLSETILGSSAPPDTEVFIEQDVFVILRQAFFPSPSDLGGLDAPAEEGPGWDTDPLPPIVRPVGLIFVVSGDGELLHVAVVVTGTASYTIII